MPSKEIQKYFDATADSETRNDLWVAVNLVEGDRVAIDCGCGAGSDITFLRSQDFLVHAFDIEEESISRCRERFRDDREVLLSKASFTTFEYPSASLIVADASLFFRPKDEFSGVWQKITNSLLPNGVFSGSFLGLEDTMAGPNYNKEAYWPDVLVTSEEKIMRWLKGFKIESFIEYRSSGKTPDGELHQWHIFSIVAKKESNTTVRVSKENNVES